MREDFKIATVSTGKYGVRLHYNIYAKEDFEGEKRSFKALCISLEKGGGGSVVLKLSPRGCKSVRCQGACMNFGKHTISASFISLSKLKATSEVTFS